MKKGVSIILFSFILLFLSVEDLGAEDTTRKSSYGLALCTGAYFNGGVKAGGLGAFIYNFNKNISFVGEFNVKFSHPKVYIAGGSFLYYFTHKLISPFAAVGVATKIKNGTTDTDFNFGGGLVYNITKSFKLRLDARAFPGDRVVQKGAKLVFCYTFLLR